jgi:hypothetical protein
MLRLAGMAFGREPAGGSTPGALADLETKEAAAMTIIIKTLMLIVPAMFLLDV